MRIASAEEVRAAIAAHVLGAANERDDLGEITLHPHQVEGVKRVTHLLEEHGGALLADDVGLGKTFVALAIAREAANPVVVAPAAVRAMWQSASERAGVPVRFVSMESLSRRWPAADASFVVIDEAHHLRSPHTHRFASACTLCRGAKVLLMTATPIQNRLADLRTLFSLFLGERAYALSTDELARYVVRRLEADLSHDARVALPIVTSPEWLSNIEDVDCLDRIVSLPPPLPPNDSGDGGVLLTYTLVRQWASSRAALRGALQRRLAHARAMHDALLAGRLPTRAELNTWCFADGAQQLTFPELAVDSAASDCATLLAQVERHADAVRELIAWLGSAPDPDTARAAAIRALLERHPEERIIAFSEYGDTVAAMYRALAPHVRAAMLTHGGGRVVGGRLSRAELLARFAPGASRRVAPSDRIDVLLTTDVLSEGVNLQDASVVVHLDLPWNPARMEQRVGRLRRIGAARDAIAVYVIVPPAPAERMLQLDRRLRVKLAVAAKSLDIAGTILPGFVRIRDSAARREEHIVSAVRTWARPRSEHDDGGAICAAVLARRDGALACVRHRGIVTLLAIGGDRVSDSRLDVQEFLQHASGDDVAVCIEEFETVCHRVESWLAQRAVSEVIDLPALRVARSRRSVLRRVETIARHAPRHAQPQLARLMHAARAAASATLSAGAERVLDELATAPMSDTAWLHAVGQFAALHARGDEARDAKVLALLVLRSS